MAKPAFHDNIFVSYPAVIEHLEKVPGVQIVLQAEDLRSLLSDDVAPLDGAVYVVIDQARPLATAGANTDQTIEIGYSLIYTRTHINPSQVYTDGGVFETWTEIAKAMQGFDPTNDKGQALTTTPFKQASALPFDYQDGYAFFPLRFVAEVSISANQE